ncbi:hypothetical protein [Geomesophilobacter sediminis]|uniref:Uncharacterized protein n=1 Tax=Geomesophilobacter sediminis TaxID=2798584 RepID=A0A8J7IW14_9BACT|nr:hypothetical protein [Geomesophilobacter sediminis]MBJ6723527.1 hypothetical protein [Geomesophilobacter sediminis]
MAKGHQQHREHLEAVSSFGKSIGKRAGFRCEWCGGDEGLRLWEYRPDEEPVPENLALLCEPCRTLADGKSADPHLLRSLRNALWSDVPAISEGAAVVLARLREPWVREAIEESFIDEELKARLLRS